MSGGMRRVGPCMPITLPDGISAFVFGSALRPEHSAQDLDVLFVYDPERIHPRAIYRALKLPIAQLSEVSGLSVHPAVLTIAEEQGDGFRARTAGCVPVEEWLERYASGRQVEAQTTELGPRRQTK